MYYEKEPAYTIDHINCDKSDNRIANLRDITLTENLQNKTKPNISNKTGLLGVYKAGNKYKALIGINYKNKHLGTYVTKEEAHDAYLVAKRNLHSGCTI